MDRSIDFLLEDAERNTDHVLRIELEPFSSLYNKGLLHRNDIMLFFYMERTMMRYLTVLNNHKNNHGESHEDNHESRGLEEFRHAASVLETSPERLLERYARVISEMHKYSQTNGRALLKNQNESI